MQSIKKQFEQKNFKEQELHKSAGILDDFAIRKDIQTQTITAGKVLNNAGEEFVPYTGAIKDVNLGSNNLKINDGNYIYTSGIISQKSYGNNYPYTNWFKYKSGGDLEDGALVISSDGDATDTTMSLMPYSMDLFNIGKAVNKFKNLHLSGHSYCGTLDLSSGSITDTSGSISFDNENLTTTGKITVGVDTGKLLQVGTGGYTTTSPTVLINPANNETAILSMLSTGGNGAWISMGASNTLSGCMSYNYYVSNTWEWFKSGTPDSANRLFSMSSTYCLIPSTNNLRFNASTENINSANSGYLDLNANTGIRLNKDTAITGNCKATTYNVGADAGVDIASGTIKGMVVKKGIVTAGTSVTPAADGTYALPTSITISGGIITAIS